MALEAYERASDADIAFKLDAGPLPASAIPAVGQECTVTWIDPTGWTSGGAQLRIVIQAKGVPDGDGVCNATNPFGASGGLWLWDDRVGSLDRWVQPKALAGAPAQYAVFPIHTNNFGESRDVSAEVLAHEIGHMLGMKSRGQTR